MLATFITIAQAASEAHAPASAGGIAALGIDGRALLFQVINFAILLWLLNRFAYTPILKVLRDRREKIEESLRAAHEIEASKQALATQHTQLLQAAHQQAQSVIAKGKEQAARLLQEAQSEAQHKAEQVMAETTARIRQEEMKIHQGLRQEILALVKEATARVIGKKLDTASDEALIQQTLQEIKK